MMRQMARGILFLVLLAGAAIAARADVTPVDLSGSSSDFKIILNDPTCDTGCVTLDYTGGPTDFIYFAAENPFPVTSSNPPGCGTNLQYWTCLPILAFHNGSFYFKGVEFFGIPPITGGDFDVELSGLPSIDLKLPNGFECAPGYSCPNDSFDVVTTPELSTFVLFGTGLVLILGGMFWRRRLSLHIAACDRAAVPVPQA